MRLRLELEATGGNTAGFRIPDEVVEQLGAGRRPPVVASVGEHTWRSSIARMGDAFWLGVSKENRDLAGVEAGQVLDLEVTVDDAPRTVEPPAELAAALESDPTLAAAWARLAPSHQKEWARSIEDAKKPETRAARVGKAITALRG
ncbi:hypothetical protein ASC77_14780 [Nocardioides sp. Root1257]|uniref:YdeI/OmpD-associated family protein n=1 Tax=unclassified Nocardioides TaxID=2615069 RepID=UPI0006FF1FE2|nr:MULTISPECIES: YdeI/OmpD-associated family protein [unclassified Nocardioides]KQW47691.1 hypothetical protein ASC77_14780 [Nocardioides sp. Root1257]KRC44943.1 hypothetical protein ASE24_15730 [Nocardioides sp. Root224]